MTDNTEKVDLLSMTPDEVAEFLSSLGEPKYRAKQIFGWMHRGEDFDGMTNISKKLRETLKEKAVVNIPTVEEKLVSKIDGTIKYLFGLSDGNVIESVFMRYKHGNTICISSEVGCPMGCKFCASTIGGLVRRLAPSELLGQVIAAEKDTGERISNIVMMGIGEPLDNYDNTVKFLRLVGDPDGLNIGSRHISVSTCGLVDKIDELSKLDLGITLSISLHAADDETRSSIMPVNKRWGVSELLDACPQIFRGDRTADILRVHADLGKERLSGGRETPGGGAEARALQEVGILPDTRQSHPRERGRGDRVQTQRRGRRQTLCRRARAAGHKRDGQTQARLGHKRLLRTA